MFLSVFYNCSWPCHHRCHSLNPFMCCLSPFQFFTVSSHSTCRISPTRNSCLEWQRSLGLSSFPFLVHNAVPVFSNTRFNDTMVILKWVLSRFNRTQGGRTHVFVIHETMLEGQLLRILQTSTYFHSPDISIIILCRIQRPNQIYYPKERT